ncbi:hypothetical protein BC332_33039 [Capsicum chinense]|nr:hypothetical protein BC332_33039 [Capsicum chinense]
MFTINPNASGDCYDSITLSWNKSTDCCAWDGVHCDEVTGQVIELDLYCSGLQGKFHTNNSSLFQLSNLKRLDLSYNNFSGSLISPKFGELSSLTHLDLSHSGFTGVIPAEISHLSKLQFLRIWSDDDPYRLRFEPYNFELLLNNLTQLRELQLDSVNISSTIPPNFSSYLTTLQLSGAQLRGILPETVFHLSNLEYLSLLYNSLTGPIPSNVLDLNNNHLSGTTNTNFNTENQLRIINLYGNKLKGKVPPSLINCRYLEFLDLGNNELNDTFPSWLGALPNLQILSLRSNKLHGPISDSRKNNLFDQIRVIDLSSNGFNGDLPVSLFENFQAMKTIGVIPSSLHQLSVLESLDLSSNKIGGEIPQQLAFLTFLVVLNLSHNHLVGCIPKGKQFDTFDNCSYQGNDGLRGLPLSNDCGGNDGVPQATTPVELDDEEEEGDLISWQAVLIGFGCGLVIGLSIIYIMLSTHYPVWFSRMAVKFERRIVTRMKRY